MYEMCISNLHTDSDQNKYVHMKLMQFKSKVKTEVKFVSIYCCRLITNQNYGWRVSIRIVQFRIKDPTSPSLLIHYDDKSMQYTAIFHGCIQ